MKRLMLCDNCAHGARLPRAAFNMAGLKAVPNIIQCNLKPSVPQLMKPLESCGEWKDERP